MRKLEIENSFAGDRTRTNTLLLRVDFESTASTIPPHRHKKFRGIVNLLVLIAQIVLNTFLINRYDDIVDFIK